METGQRFPQGRTGLRGQLPQATPLWVLPLSPHLCASRSPTSHRSLQLQSLHAEGKQGLPGPNVQKPCLLSQGQRQEVLDARLGEPPDYCSQLCRAKKRGWAGRQERE